MNALTITDEQIETLRTEAGQAGDALMVQICSIALSDLDLDTTAVAIDERSRSALERKGIIPEHVNCDMMARKECARVIATTAERSCDHE